MHRDDPDRHPAPHGSLLPVVQALRSLARRTEEGPLSAEEVGELHRIALEALGQCQEWGERYEPIGSDEASFDRSSAEGFVEAVIDLERRYGLSIGHESTEGGFVLEEYRKENAERLRAALQAGYPRSLCWQCYLVSKTVAGRCVRCGWVKR